MHSAARQARHRLERLSISLRFVILSPTLDLEAGIAVGKRSHAERQALDSIVVALIGRKLERAERKSRDIVEEIGEASRWQPDISRALIGVQAEDYGNARPYPDYSSMLLLPSDILNPAIGTTPAA